MLVGKRTYILAALAGGTTIAYAVGWISQETWQVLMGIFVPGGIATLKAGLSTETEKVIQKVQVLENKEKECK